MNYVMKPFLALLVHIWYSQAASIHDRDEIISSSWLLQHGLLLSLLSIITVIILSVLLVALCGGCEDMEVGTESHPACGSNTTWGGGYEMVSVSDVNTNVLNSGFHGEKLHQSQYDQALPYAIAPPGVNVASGFSGYEAQGSRVELPYVPKPSGFMGYESQGNVPPAPRPAAQSNPVPIAPVARYGYSMNISPPTYDESIRQTGLAYRPV